MSAASFLRFFLHRDGGGDRVVIALEGAGVAPWGRGDHGDAWLRTCEGCTGGTGRGFDDGDGRLQIGGNGKSAMVRGATLAVDRRRQG
jgi:hypothetical protein